MTTKEGLYKKLVGFGYILGSGELPVFLLCSSKFVIPQLK